MGTQLDNDRLKAAEVITAYVKEHGSVEMTNKEIMSLLEENDASPIDVMYQNTDICYNLTNKANLDTFKEDVHIFEYLGRNSYKLLGSGYPYTGEVIRNPRDKNLSPYCVGEWYNGELIAWKPDEFIKSDKLDSALNEEAEEIEASLSSLNVTGEEKLILAKERINQGVFRQRLLRRYSHCCLCGVGNTGLLWASHIKPWSISEPEEKVDVNNGFLFCPNHDKVFDKGYISFDDSGAIMISSELSSLDKTFLNLNENMKIAISDKNMKYLAYHRKYIFRS